MFKLRFFSPVTLADCFYNIFGVLRQRVVEHAAAYRLSPEFAGRICERIAHLTARIEARLAIDPSALPPPRPYRPAAGRTIITPPEAIRLPRGFDWLRRLMPGDGVNDCPTQTASAQLWCILSAVETQDRIAIDPVLARLVRPLCHMMGVTLPEALRTPTPRPAPILDANDSFEWPALPAPEAEPPARAPAVTPWAPPPTKPDAPPVAKPWFPPRPKLWAPPIRYPKF